MRFSTNKDGESLFHFDPINESEASENTSLHLHLTTNHDGDVHRRKIKEILNLENILGFRLSFKKIIRQLCVHLTFKTANLIKNYFYNIWR